MENQHRYREALRLALGLLGNERRLAAYLRVPPDTLSAWLEDRASVPLEAYLDVLDVVGEESFLLPRKDYGLATH
jgi:DNA-binding transcriptional regulator YiaG